MNPAKSEPMSNTRNRHAASLRGLAASNPGLSLVVNPESRKDFPDSEQG